ncbi:hypothetical protein UFOVP219_33 [uncultured Caudovirales phage]|uniref:Uncharacterized protein n=1 Tax=uncultured Caudovirales phage TaxID=2100421 RepID=A0A6J7WL52_9CAUD|nr:hypothetical protein UFOVP219_33 [uncultured Caudovirales phage]
MAFKTWSIGDVLTASDLNSYVAYQTVSIYGSSAIRGTGIPAGTAGQPSYVTDNKRVELYDGTNWQPLPAAISAFTATQSGALAINTGTTVAVAFPSGRFAVAPIVTVSTNSTLLTPYISAVTAGTVTVGVFNNGNASSGATTTIYGIAVAMASGTAAG